MEIRALAEQDDRSQFRSGDDELDQFFHRFAGQNQFRHFIGVTYVATAGARIAGFATVAPGHVEIDRLPLAARRGLPTYPIPVLRLARLAVDESGQGGGIGGALLRIVFGLAMRMAGDVGCVGVVVDAKAGVAGFYERYGFVAIDAVQGASDARPKPTVMFLSVATLRRTIEN